MALPLWERIKMDRKAAYKYDVLDASPALQAYGENHATKEGFQAPYGSCGSIVAPWASCWLEADMDQVPAFHDRMCPWNPSGRWTHVHVGVTYDLFPWEPVMKDPALDENLGLQISCASATAALAEARFQHGAHGDPCGGAILSNVFVTHSGHRPLHVGTMLTFLKTSGEAICGRWSHSKEILTIYGTEPPALMTSSVIGQVLVSGLFFAPALLKCQNVHGAQDDAAESTKIRKARERLGRSAPSPVWCLSCQRARPSQVLGLDGQTAAQYVVDAKRTRDFGPGEIRQSGPTQWWWVEKLPAVEAPKSSLLVLP